MANIFIITIDINEDALVKINYTVPKYREYQVGQFFLMKQKIFN